MDNDTAVPILESQLKDISELLQSSTAQGQLSDSQLALELRRENVESCLVRLRSRKVVRRKAKARIHLKKPA